MQEKYREEKMQGQWSSLWPITRSFLEIEQEDIRKTQDDLEKTDHLTRLLTRREGEKQIAGQ